MALADEVAVDLQRDVVLGRGALARPRVLDERAQREDRRLGGAEAAAVLALRDEEADGRLGVRQTRGFGDERERRGISVLPGSLLEAIEEAEKSDLLRSALGDHVFESLIANKRIEWDDYRRQITDYELRRYLPIL